MSDVAEPRRWTVGALAAAAATALADRGIESSRLESDLLLAEVLGWDRIAIYTRHDMPVSDADRARFRDLVRRRLKREPLAYALGRREFLDHVFIVSPDVLIPRPETEHVVEAALDVLGDAAEPTVLDVGVGSGCILLSILAALPSARGLGVDVSEKALRVAARNAERLGVADRCRLVHHDATSGLPAGSFHLIVSNPPYVTPGEAETLMPDVRDYEPAEALFVEGDDPLAWHRALLEQAPASLRPGGVVVLELPATVGDLRGEVRSDLAGRARVLIARVASDQA